ncbi:hypothetical protein [Flavobacterium soli]|uniref:hypothetical protein n=1 Tax=Flavobacterium soli TaxID=344881 RepID=UPI0004165546|nr:hypothetical protein [Flavobacterium soli]
MKNNLIKMLSGTLLFALFSTSCSLPDDNKDNCVQVIGVATDGVVGPVEATIDQEITLNVTYKIAASCGEFYIFSEQTVSSTEKKVAILATYDVCNCNNVYTTKTQPYKFKVATAGVYSLKFATENNAFITHVITVE